MQINKIQKGTVVFYQAKGYESNVELWKKAKRDIDISKIEEATNKLIKEGIYA